jgi:hypothetical protein
MSKDRGYSWETDASMVSCVGAEEWERLREAVEAAKRIVDVSYRRAVGEVEVMRMVVRERGEVRGRGFGGRFFRPDGRIRGEWVTVVGSGGEGDLGALDGGSRAWERLA